MTMTTEWVKVKDDCVRLIWICNKCKNKLAVSPTIYAEMNTLMCSNCEEDMGYVHTEILVTRKP